MLRWLLPRTWRPMGRHQRQFANRQDLYDPGGCAECDGEGRVWIVEDDRPVAMDCPNGCPEPDPF